MPVEVAWPATLPQNVLHDQFSYTAGSGLIRNETDTGYPLVRRRFTGTTDTYAMALVMTYAQYKTFEDFFRNSPDHPTLPGAFLGSVRVAFPEPLWSPADGETEADRPTVSLRFVTSVGNTPYTVTPNGGSGDVVVSFTMEKTP